MCEAIMENRTKEFAKLQKENNHIRMDIDKFAEANHVNVEKLWSFINKLIENELQQEELCD